MATKKKNNNNKASEAKAQLSQDQLGKLVIRRHPQYDRLIKHWEFVDATYEGGRSWFAENIFQYYKEGNGEYKERVARAYRFNHTKQVVDLVDKYIFKVPVSRNEEDAPESVKKFWNQATLNGGDVNTLVQLASNLSSRLGRVWAVVDNNAPFGDHEKPLTLREEKEADSQIYAYVIRPQDMLDMSYDERGRMVWALVREAVRDDEDPFTCTGNVYFRYRLWTRTNWHLFENKNDVAIPGKNVVSGSEARQHISIVASGEHDLGEVPIVAIDHAGNDDPYEFQGLVDDIAYLDRANANYLSDLDAIIQDQTFSQLVIPAQAINASDDKSEHSQVVEMGTRRVFTYDASNGAAPPSYISPDPRQAGMILSAIGKIINEIYHSVGLSAERTKDDNGGGVDNSSGVAKAYDFERVNAILNSKARALQSAERSILRLVAKWAGDWSDDSDESKWATYPEKFDTRSLYDEIEMAQKLQLVSAPDELRRAQMRTLAQKLFPAAPEKQAKEFEKSLEKWPLDPIEQAQKMAAAVAPANDPSAQTDEKPKPGEKGKPTKPAPVKTDSSTEDKSKT